MNKMLMVGIIAAAVIGAIITATSFNTSEDVMKSDFTNQEIAKLAIKDTIKDYEAESGDLSVINLEYPQDDQTTRYVFVYDPTSREIVAHPNAELLGQDMFSVVEPDKTYEEIATEFASNEHVKINYEYVNRDTSEVEPKISILKLYDELWFGSGYHKVVN